MGVRIEVIDRSSNGVPRIATVGSAGLDLRAFVADDIIVSPLERVLIGTGLYMAIPAGYEGQVRSRSGLSYKNGIIVLNAPGTIDSDYRGEVKVLLINLSNDDFTVHNGDRIAQMVFSSYVVPEFEIVDELPCSDRGRGGFGSTGISQMMSYSEF